MSRTLAVRLRHGLPSRLDDRGKVHSTVFLGVTLRSGRVRASLLQGGIGLYAIYSNAMGVRRTNVGAGKDVYDCPELQVCTVVSLRPIARDDGVSVFRRATL